MNKVTNSYILDRVLLGENPNSYICTNTSSSLMQEIGTLVEMETRLKTEELTTDLLKEAKRIEFPDKVIASLSGKTEEQVKKMRYDNGITAAFKMVDTCAAEFAATRSRPYTYQPDYRRQSQEPKHELRWQNWFLHIFQGNVLYCKSN